MCVRVAVLVLWGAVGVAASAHAQPTDATRARALFERGLMLTQDGRRAEAAQAFQASLDLVPRASTALNLAIVLEELGRSREALQALDVVGAQGTGATDEDQRDAERLRATLARQLATLTLTIDPPDATLEIDGRVDGSTGSTRIVVMDPGPHVLRVTAAGHVPVELELGAVAGAETMDIVRLAPTVQPPSPAEVAADAETPGLEAHGEPLEESPGRGVRRRRRLAGGIAAAVVAIAAVVLAVTLAPRSDDPDAGTSGVVFEPFR